MRISCLMHQLMGVPFSISIRAQKPHLLFRCDQIGERVEFYCNGKEVRAAPRQNLRICARAACSMHCAYRSHTFLARNHLLASLLLSAGRRDAAVRVSCLRAEKNARCFVIYTAPPFYCRVAVAQGVAAAAGPQFRSTMGSICMIGLFVRIFF